MRTPDRTPDRVAELSGWTLARAHAVAATAQRSTDTSDRAIHSTVQSAHLPAPMQTRPSGIMSAVHSGREGRATWPMTAGPFRSLVAKLPLPPLLSKSPLQCNVAWAGFSPAHKYHQGATQQSPIGAGRDRSQQGGYHGPSHEATRSTARRDPARRRSQP